MKTVLIQQRNVATGQCTDSLPKTVGAAGTHVFQALVTGAIQQIVANEVIRVRILNADTLADSPLLVILQAWINTDDAALGAPAFAGTFNGTLDEAKWQGECVFQSNDFPGVTSMDWYFSVWVSNPDSAGHAVDTFDVTFEVTRTQWSEPSYGSPIE